VDAVDATVCPGDEENLGKAVEVVEAVEVAAAVAAVVDTTATRG
jgi:hypothetical protein